MSFVVKRPVLLSDYSLKYRDHKIEAQSTFGSEVEDRFKIPEGTFENDGAGDKRIGRKTKFCRFEFCSYAYTIPDEFNLEAFNS